MFTLDELYDLEGLANDAIFAWRKRLQHAQGKISLNVPGNDPRNTVCEYSVEACKHELDRAIDWYDRLSEMTSRLNKSL